MPRFRLGCVPYVNARPLVDAFDQPDSEVEVTYDVPSRLPRLLDGGEVDAILVSSVEHLRRDDLQIVSRFGIMSEGPVASVRMLSKVPISEIRSLALDQSSMTSNLLAQLVLAEQNVFPKLNPFAPSVPEMLSDNDACVIIGDLGMEADGTGLIDIDLGAAWAEMTGLPFVWALWLGRIDSDLSELNSLLDNAFQPISDELISRAAARSGWTKAQTRSYLENNVRFDLPSGPSLDLFRALLKKHGLIELTSNHSSLQLTSG